MKIDIPDYFKYNRNLNIYKIEKIDFNKVIAPRIYKSNTYGSTGLTYCVYSGCNKKVVSDALALRLDNNGKNIWV